MLIEMLRNEGSTLVKQSMLKAYATSDWQKAFWYAYHPDKKYGVKNIPIGRYPIGDPIPEMFLLLDKLDAGFLSGNSARDALIDFAEKHGELILLICRKDMGCGVTATTLNKVFGKGFIPQFKVQLAEEVAIRDVKLPIIGQLKYDGVRVVAFIQEDGIVFKTRNGNTFKFPALALQLLESKYVNTVLDGELVFGDGSMETRTSVSGIVNSAIHGTPIANPNINFVVFDAMTVDAFNTQQCGLTYDMRYGIAKEIVESINNPMVQIAGIYEFDTHEQIEGIFATVTKCGLEGLILKRWNHKYTFKRSKDWIKIKAIKDCTLKCIEVQYGKQGTKYDGLIGGLVCKGTVEGKEVTVTVGSGLSDHERTNQAHSHYIGEKIDVKYNAVIQDSKTKEWSLFLPRYVCVRRDI